METFLGYVFGILFIAAGFYVIGGFFTVFQIFGEVFKNYEEIGFLLSIKKNLNRSSEVALLVFLPMTLFVSLFSAFLYLFMHLIVFCFHSVDTLFKDLSSEESHLSKMLEKIDTPEEETTKAKEKQTILDDYIQRTQDRTKDPHPVRINQDGKEIVYFEWEKKK